MKPSFNYLSLQKRYSKFIIFVHYHLDKVRGFGRYQLLLQRVFSSALKYYYYRKIQRKESSATYLAIAISYFNGLCKAQILISLAKTSYFIEVAQCISNFTFDSHYSGFFAANFPLKSRNFSELHYIESRLQFRVEQLKAANILAQLDYQLQKCAFVYVFLIHYQH